MKNIFVFLFIVFLCGLTANPISYEKNLNGFYRNPAFLGIESNAGIYYKFDYMDQNESRLSLRLSKFAGFGYDLESHITYWSGGFSLLRDFYCGLTLIDPPGKSSRFDAGFIYRPFAFLSGGLKIDDCFKEHSSFATEASFKFYEDMFILNSGINFVFNGDKDSYEAGKWYGGLNFRPVKGCNLYFEYREDDNFYGGAKFDFSNLSLMYDTEFDDDRNQTSRQAVQVTVNKLKPFWEKEKIKQIVLNKDYSDESELIELYLNINRVIAEHPAEIEFIFRNAELSLQAAEELNGLIAELRGKIKVRAYIDQANLSNYYAVSSADEVYLSEFGNFDMSHKSLLSADEIYLEEFSNVEMASPFFVIKSLVSDLQVMQVGKNLFVEDILENKKLEAEKRNMLTQIQLDIQDRIYKVIAVQKGIPIESMFVIANESPSSAFTAEDAGLINEISAPEEKSQPGKLIDFQNNLLTGSPQPWVKPEAIAVIEISGFIKSGKSHICDNAFYGKKICGTDTVFEQLREAECDPDIKGVVLRVNSGGGELIACGTLYQKIRDFSKPIIASVSGQASAGAYFAVSGADKIYANDSSLLGGLGVAVLKNNKRLIPLTDNYNAGKDNLDNADDRSNFLSSEMQYRYLADQYYKQMIRRIASERSTPFSNIDDKGEASLYDGAEALNRNLTDETGSFFEALNYARKITHLSSNGKIIFRNLKLDKISDLEPERGFYYYNGLIEGI
ncbi:MAG: hypothetical protein CSB55_01510 [Candidatus Cloacimonadota bacterium]|nr:MAG: hypothetical protein CSB55_01510 [Candidatus Cloacimonadota bacterium]